MIGKRFWIIGRGENALYVLCGQAMYDAWMKVITPSYIRSQAVLLTFLVSEPFSIGWNSISRHPIMVCATDVTLMAVLETVAQRFPEATNFGPDSHQIFSLSRKGWYFLSVCIFQGLSGGTDDTFLTFLCTRFNENWDFLDNLRTTDSTIPKT